MKKIYNISLDIVDDTVEFVKESGDKSDDIDNIPTDLMLEYIQKAIHRLSQMQLSGVYVTNVKVTMPVYGVKE
jgi:hypothetical protein